jgi:hypothetical protein
LVQPALDPLGTGIQAGMLRLERYQLAFAEDAVESAILMTQELLSVRGEAMSERFAELFGEIVTVAACARAAYKEPQLTKDDVAQFLDFSIVFLNSFRHA